MSNINDAISALSALETARDKLNEIHDRCGDKYVKDSVDCVVDALNVEIKEMALVVERMKKEVEK